MNPQALLASIKDRLTLDIQHLARLQRLWLMTYRYYGILLHPEQEAMYAQDLLPYPLEEVERAMQLYRVTPPPQGHKPRPPVPVDIIPMLTDYVSPEAEANEMAADIFAAIKLGYNHADIAEAKLGPIAWGIVQRLGGWAQLCRESKTDEARAFHAQVRDLALGALQRRHNAKAQAPTHKALVDGATPAQALGAQPVASVPRRLPKPSPYLEEFNKLVAQVLEKSG